MCDCGAPGKCDCATCAMATFCPWGMHGATAKMLRSGQRYDACSGWDAPECAISAGLYVGGSVMSCILNACVADVLAQKLRVRDHGESAEPGENIRDRHGINEAPLGDFCCHCWCHPCAVAQEHYQVKSALPPSDPYGGVPPTMYVQPVAQSMPQTYAGPAAPQQQPYAPQQQPHTMDDERAPKRAPSPSEGNTSSRGEAASSAGGTPPAKRMLFQHGEAAAREERRLLREAGDALAAKGGPRGKGKGNGGGKGGGGHGGARPPPWP